MQHLLVENALLDWLDQKRIDRLLYTEPGGKWIILFDVENPKALPVRRKRQDVLEAIENDEARLLDFDKYLPTPQEDVKSKHRKRQEKLWQLIEPIVTDEERIVLYKKRGSQSRNKLLDEAMERAKREGLPGKKSKRYVLEVLRRYWRRGQVPDALLPNYRSSRLDGKPKTIDKKRGRPSRLSVAEGRPRGVNVDRKMLKIFKRAIEKHYLTKDQNSLKRVHLLMLKDDFNARLEVKDGVEVPILDPTKDYPTYRQFTYHYNKDRDYASEIAARRGQNELDKNHRALKSRSIDEVYGPGSVFQIDATKFDFYLVSSIDRSPIGRPILYFIVDIFSTMIVGYALNFEGPSWYAASLALLNMNTDKVEHCKLYGRNIEPHEWPSRHCPQLLVADGGELAGLQATSIPKSLRSALSIAPSGRADLKGDVEQKFNIFSADTKRWLKGSVAKKLNYGDSRGLTDARYTLEEFRGTIVDTLIYHNAKHEKESYKLDRDMMRDSVRAVPNELWNWGVRNRSGGLKTLPDDYVRKAVLTRANGSITREGLKFKGERYEPELDISHLQIEAGIKGTRSIRIAYDPFGSMNLVYLIRDQGKSFVPAHLDTSSSYYNLAFPEMEHHENQRKLDRAGRTNDNLQDRIELEARLQKRDAEADAKTVAARKGKSKAEVLADTGKRRDQERQLERDLHSMEGEGLPTNEPEQVEVGKDAAPPRFKIPKPGDGVEK